MIQTFAGLRSRVMRILDESDEIASSSSTTRVLVEDALNYAHQLRCTEYPWAFMRWPTAITFQTVPGQRLYSLHYEFDKPIDFINTTTKQYLQEVPLRAAEALTLDIDPPTGSAAHFSFTGYSAVARQPSATGVLSLVSTTTADTGSTQQVVVKGELADGTVIAEILTPSGTTPVTSNAEYRTILAVTKETEWAGVLTLKDAAANTLLTLQPYEMGRKYPLITIHEIPATAETISYRFYRQPLVLVNDYDQPEIPPPYAQVLVWDALIQMSAYLTDLPANKLQTWQVLQDQALLALQRAYGSEGQSVSPIPATVRTIATYGN